MQEVLVNKSELYSLIKQAVREVLEEEIIRLRLKNLPFISEEEMANIAETYEKPHLTRDIGRSETLEI